MRIGRRNDGERSQEERFPPWKMPEDLKEDDAYRFAEHQMFRYNKNTGRAQRGYIISEIAFVCVAAATTVIAALQVSAVWTASLAAASLVIGGLRSIFDWRGASARSATASARVYVAMAIYAMKNPRRPADTEKLKKTVCEIIATETGKWSEHMTQQAH